MSVLFRFQPGGLTREKYDQINRDLEQSGAWPPPGLQLHVMFGNEGDLRVSEIWESEEQQHTFSAQLLPALERAGVQLSGQPDVFEVHELQQP